MIDFTHLRNRFCMLARSGRGDHGAQLVEFAVSLPLLVLFVVGIFDFSNAFTLKQKLTNIARDAARVAAGEPASDLQSYSTNAPASVLDAFQDIDNYLVANNLSDCSVGLLAASGLTWTYRGTSGCPPGGLMITINRGYYFPATGAPPPSATCTPQNPGATNVVIGTCVSIQYAYPWRFGRVASLLGANATLPTQISAVAVALNEN